ncbi:MAG TPA: DNA-directed RNA polymerase subunit omega [Candidatus Poseidoniales archaeon]|nr:DNA-directed RNA polymerase subunit omega [Candidatus Poseidoniales archaeon]
MFDIDRMEAIYDQCGGVFKTTVLLQKRVRELNRGAERLITTDMKNPISIALLEIEQGKLALVPDDEENRELLRQEIERRQTGGVVPEIEVPAEVTEDELERRIMSALSKERSL